MLHNVFYHIFFVPLQSECKTKPMNLTELIHHPERMDRETLYDLRSLTALHPYYQTARILMLQNLFLLHDPTFDEELRRAAIYITDRRVLFQMVEAAHYKVKSMKNDTDGHQDKSSNRTSELIDTFLGSIPKDEQERPKGRKPTPADAAVDYVAYLMESGIDDSESEPVPLMKGQTLIDEFISKEGSGRIILPELETESYEASESTEPIPDDICTETMAQIYVRQGRYSQALEIIKRLNLDNPKKNAYFADQIRFLEKLILNNNKTNITNITNKK